MLSIVVPVFNEEESLISFYKELRLSLKRDENYEIIFVDDGSVDNSLKLLKEIAQKDKTVKIYSFRKNQGKAEALTLGFEKAKGDNIVTLDADLQDQPNQIALLQEKLDSGFDLVSGWRKDRKDAFKHIVFSKMFNFLARTLWSLKLHDYNCGLKIYKSKCAKSLRLYGGLHRFIPLLAYEQGFRVAEISVIHQKRQFGKSKYGISKVWKDLPDMFTMFFLSKYGKKPMHFFGIIGFIFLLIGFGILTYLTVGKIFYEQSIGNRPILFLGMLLVLGGFQVLFTGFLADLIINKSYEQNSPVLKFSTE